MRATTRSFQDYVAFFFWMQTPCTQVLCSLLVVLNALRIAYYNISLCAPVRQLMRHFAPLSIMCHSCYPAAHFVCYVRFSIARRSRLSHAEACGGAPSRNDMSLVRVCGRRTNQVAPRPMLLLSLAAMAVWAHTSASRLLMGAPLITTPRR